MTARCALLSLFALLATAEASAQDQSKAIFQGWIGRTLVLDVQNRRGELRYETDGATSTTTPTQDSGRWRWDDSGPGYCVRWQKLRRGEEACFTIVTVGADRYIVYRGGNEVAAKVIEVK